MKKIFAVGDQQWLGGLTPRLEEARVGYRLAKTPKELASYLKKETPALVLCDLKMPKLSGFDVLRQIKAARIDIAVVMVKDPATFDFATLTQVFEMKRYAPEEKSKQVRAPTLSLSTAPELHNPRSGRLDARRVADFFGMAPARLAKVLGRSPQALHKTPDAESLQKPLAVFARIATSLLSAFEEKEQARIWLNSPNPDLDETRPIELVEQKKPDVVAELLEDALLGHPG
ncbi:MAG: response regulator [Acidobacteriota bacterium]|nr:response regulator [Acidobacteriota bacterium]